MNSARLTDQRGSYAFSCSPYIHIRHLLPTPDIKHVFDFKQENDLHILCIS